MGFGVGCEGVELLNSLRTNEDIVFGRRYPLYIIALATEVDDDAIKWLTKYARAIDSLTGKSIAFIIFYNSVRLYATANTFYKKAPIDQEGTEKIFHRSLQTFDVPSAALQSNKSLNKYVKGRVRFPDEAFVTSMTYQSDNIARSLGIKPTELPCFLFIDDPNSREYHLLQ